MIIEYQRPNTIPEALQLLAREQPVSFALGGGTFLNRGTDAEYAVIDLQNLDLRSIKISSNLANVGATCTLQELVGEKGLPEDLYHTLEHEATYNLRHMATVAGTLVTANGRSPFATVLLALDTSLEIQHFEASTQQVKLGDWLPMRSQPQRGKLISSVSFPVNLKLAYEAIARTPADQPILCCAVAMWKSGRTRVALGGWGEAPILAMDGPEPGGIEVAARNSTSHSGDQWASEEYRQEMAVILSQRCLQKINSSLA